MNQIWFGPEDETDFWQAISQNVGVDLFDFIAQQVDLRFADDDFYHLLSTAYGLETPTDIRVILGVATEDLDQEDTIPVGITIITRPFRVVEIGSTLLSNYNRIIALSGAYAVHVNSSSSPIDYWEFDPAEGMELAHFPADMFTDNSIFWFERVRVTADNQLTIQRGGSVVSPADFVALFTDPSSFIVINETDKTWVLFDLSSADTTSVHPIKFLPASRVELAANIGTATSTNEWLQNLADSELVIAAIPNQTFRPEFV